ncbi:MAG: hypothetical protein ACTSVI_07835 [Promethearchaeota archaeon]
MDIKIGFVVFYHSFEEGAENAQNVFNSGDKVLLTSEIDHVNAPCLVHDLSTAREAGEFFKKRGIHFLIIHLATWSDDRLLLKLLSSVDVPVINWALQDVNSGSLCGCQQFNMVLKELGKYSRVIIGYSSKALDAMKENIMIVSNQLQEIPGNIKAINESHERSIILDIIEKLKHLRVGLIGHRTQGMMEIAHDEFSIREILGPVVESYCFEEINEIRAAIGNEEIQDALSWFKSKNPGIKIKVDDDTLSKAMGMYLALDALVSRDNLDALTYECYPRHMGEACIAFSLLSEKGIPCACEADVHSAILMWLLQSLSRSPTNHADLLDFNIEENTIVGGHCGSCAISLKGQVPAQVTPVRLANKGACIQFPTKPGTVVLVNLVGRKSTYRAYVVKGVALNAPLVFPGNPTTIKLSISIEEFLKIVNDNGFGHHWIVAYGHEFLDHLVSILEILGINVVVSS